MFCGKTIVPVGMTGPQFSFKFTIRSRLDGGFLMELVTKLCLCLNLGLLFAHEMDAVRCREWRMIPLLKDLDEEKAYNVFVLGHIPLYLALLAVLTFATEDIMSKVLFLVNLFFLIHSILHVRAMKNPEDKFNFFSNLLIHVMGLSASIQVLWFADKIAQ